MIALGVATGVIAFEAAGISISDDENAVNASPNVTALVVAVKRRARTTLRNSVLGVVGT